MADMFDSYAELNNDITYLANNPVLIQPPVTNVFSGDVTTIITTINGNSGGGASGPSVTFSGGSTGYSFNASGQAITLQVANAATARTSIGAAASGANADINSFSALTGNTGVNPWTGTPNGSSQSTYPATVASVGYVQAEMQGLMDKMQDVTEFMMFLVAALLAPGVVET